MRKLLPLVTDALLVAVFCAIGRRSHDEAVLAGLLRTLWPFASGLAVGWLIVAARVRWGATTDDTQFTGTALWPTGVVIWISTLTVGMLLRVVSGQGTALSFILVAGTILGLLILGWRTAYSALR
ncbi:DUF3054 domain-containing protein [Nocardia sp. 004]|uniref:DUF3054 domain-containing protein n=1 Tax=Nocardia sp. 004 TaxID=3385978 RepID=UPI0039A03CA0